MFNETIFDRETRTKLKILDIIGSDSQWYSAEKLSQMTDIERKTILKYINELIDDSITFSPKKELTIHSIKSRGISLEVQCKHLVSTFKLFILGNTFTMELLRRLFFHLPCNLTKMSQQFFVSESTIRRKIKLFKEILAPYGIEISYKDKSYTLVGEETQIRMYGNIVFWTIYRGNMWPYDMLEEEKMLQMTKQLLTCFGVSPAAISKVELKMLTSILSISVIRLHKGKSIPENDVWNLYEKTNSISPQLEAFAADYHLPISEIQFFYLILQTFSETYMFSEPKERILAAHKKNNTPAYQATVLFFEAFEKNFKTVLSDDVRTETFGHVLASHIFTDLFKSFKVDMSGYNFNQKAHTIYPHLSKNIYELIDQLAATSGLALFREREQLHMKYMLFFSMIERLTKFEKTITIRFESDLPELVSNMLKESIFNTFNNWYNLKTVENISSSNEDNADVIIATFDISHADIQQRQLKTIYISPDFTFEDFTKLGKIFKEIAGQ